MVIFHIWYTAPGEPYLVQHCPILGFPKYGLPFVYGDPYAVYQIWFTKCGMNSYHIWLPIYGIPYTGRFLGDIINPNGVYRNAIQDSFGSRMANGTPDL